MTTTVVAVMHDAHVCARATFVAARTAMVQVATARRARAATRAATRATVRATTKVVRAANVVAKEAAEKHASAVNGHAVRVANRAAHKAYCAPAVRAAKRAAACEAKVVRAMRTASILAVRATRMAAKVAPVIATAKAAIDAVYARATMVVPATVVRTVRVPRTLKGPTVGLTLEQKVTYKAMRLDTRRGATKAPVVYTLNSAEVRERITARDRARAAGRAAQRAAEAALLAAMVHKHQATGLSLATIEARAAQGAAQREANATRKAGMPVKAPRPHVVIVRTGPVKNKGAKRVHTPRVHTVESALAQVAKKAAIVKAKEDAAIAKAKKWAMRKAAYANRKAAMEQIASDAWMLKGVWLPEDLIRAANDWSYSVRIGAFKEARAIAYAKAPVAQGVAA